MKRVAISETARALVCVAILSALLHALCVWHISRFYSLNIAHYDSVGGYIFGFEILNAYGRGGWSSAFALAGTNSLSVTQSYFAAVFAPLLAKTPASFQIYNSFAITLAMLAIVVFARGAGFTVAGSVLLASLLLVPDGLWWWDFGLQDYRRDPAMFGFLASGAFLSISTFVGDWSDVQRRAVAIAAGICTGLALISRDSAVIYVFGIIVVPAIALFVREGLVRGPAHAMRTIVPIVLSGLPFAAIFAANIQQMAARMFDLYLGFGRGDDALRALAMNANLIVEIVTGPFARLSVDRRPGFTTGLVLSGLLLLFGTWIAGLVEVRLARLRSTVPVVLGLIALWIIFYLHVFIAGYVKLNPDLSWPMRAPPYLPALVGWLLFAAALGHALRFRCGFGVQFAVAGVVAIGVLVGASVRMSARVFEYDPVVKELNQEIGRLPHPSGRPPVVAELWFETVRIPAVHLIALQEGRSPPQRLGYTFEGARMDFAIGVPQGISSATIAAIQKAMETALRCDSDFIIVTTKLDEYDVSNSPLFLFRHGRGIVERLLQDLSPPLIGPKPSGHRWIAPVAVLDNRERKHCAR